MWLVRWRAGTPAPGHVCLPSRRANCDPDQLRKHGFVQRNYLGLSLVGLTESIVTREKRRNPNFPKIDAGTGVLVTEVMDDSPARAAGVREGDVLLSVNGLPVTEPDAVVESLGIYEEGKTFKLELVRPGYNGSKPFTAEAKPLALKLNSRGPPRGGRFG